jgi:WD40 repeat protein
VHLSYDKKSDRIVYAANRSIYLRSVENPEQSVQYSKHTFPTSVAKFSPSGFYIASGDIGGNVKIWDAVGEEMVTKGEYQIISGRINDLEWDADSQRIIAVGDGKERFGHCFTYDSGNSVGEITGHSEQANAVSIRPIRPYRAATVSDDSNLIFYHGPPFKFALSHKDKHTNFVHDVRFSPDGQHFLSVGADRKIALYDGKTGDFVSFIENSHQGSIFSVAWSPDSKQFVTASADSTVVLWDIESKKSVKHWSFEKTLENQQVGVVFAGKFIISLSYSGDLHYLEESSDDVKIVKGHQKSITALEIIDGLVYTGSYDGRICKWVDSKAELVATHKGLVVGITNTGHSISWDDTLRDLKVDKGLSLEGQPKGISSNSNLIGIITENSISLIENNSILKSTSLEKSPTCIAVGSEYVAIGDVKNSVHLYDRSLTHKFTLPGLQSVPTILSISQNGQYLAAGDSSGKITLYSIPDKSVHTRRWAFHTSKVTSIAWHESGNYVVSGALDTSIIIYSVEKPNKNVKFLGAHTDGTNGVVWKSANEIVSAGADATVKTWKVELQ